MVWIEYDDAAFSVISRRSTPENVLSGKEKNYKQGGKPAQQKMICYMRCVNAFFY